MVDGMKDVLEKGGSKSLQGKTVALVFYIPSVRTRLSFEMAAIKLGGDVISTENTGRFFSVIPNENPLDAIRFLVGHRFDCIVLRYEKDEAEKIAEKSSVPIINAGEDGGQHPSQALIDLYTLYKKRGGLIIFT